MKKIFLFSFLFLFLFNTMNVFAIEVSAPNAILIDIDSGRSLFQKEAYSPVYPASTTKVLTAILAFENCDLDEKVTASYTAINSVYAGGTTASIQEGETHTVRDLLYTMLVHSANDAAYILAEHIGGSTTSFASMMNSRAKELGAKSTFFVNPNGLPSTTHKCSAYDMALFARHAMKEFPEFREMVKATSFSLPITKEYEDLYFRQFPDATEAHRYLYTTTNHLINPERSDYYYEYATGIKTGYTDAAANCIVASAEKDGVELIVVIFGSNGWRNLRTDCVNLFEYGFSRLHSENLTVAGESVNVDNFGNQIMIKNAEPSNNMLSVLAEGSLKVTLASTDLVDEPLISYKDDLKAPIKKGDVIGTITYNVNNSSYTTNLIAGNDVDSKVTLSTVANNVVETTVNIFGMILKFVLFTFLLLVILFIMAVLIKAYIMTKKQRQRSHRRAKYNSRFRT